MREATIWRPIMAGKVRIEEVKAGWVDLVDLLKINALLDFEAAQIHAQRENAK
jgi:hypothetical protein